MTTESEEHRYERYIIMKYRQLNKHLRTLSEMEELLFIHSPTSDFLTINRIKENIIEEIKVVEAEYPHLDYVFKVFKDERVI